MSLEVDCSVLFAMCFSNHGKKKKEEESSDVRVTVFERKFTVWLICVNDDCNHVNHNIQDSMSLKEVTY